VEWEERIAESRHPHYIVAGIDDDGWAVFDLEGAQHYEAALELAMNRVRRREAWQSWWCVIYHIEPVAEVRMVDGGAVKTEILDNTCGRDNE